MTGAPGAPEPARGTAAGEPSTFDAAGADRGFGAMWAEAPAAIAVVGGPAHTVVYANAAYERLAYERLARRRGDGDGDAPRATLVGQSAVVAVAPTAAAALVALLDAVRHGAAAVRGALSTGGGDDLDAWQCTVWPLQTWPGGASSGAGPNGGPQDGRDERNLGPSRRAEDRRDDPPDGLLVLAIDASSYAEVVNARHRDLTELVLLGALREEDRADVAETARVGAEQAHAARGRFLARLSHELRTPLQAVLGYADMLAMGLRGPVTEPQRDALARIQLGVGHLVGLATALLDYGAVEAGHVTYVPSAVRVGTVLQAAATLVGPQGAAQGVSLTVAPCDERLTVHADDAKVRQVVLNLLANAIKFTGAGGAVTLAAAARPATTPVGEASRPAVVAITVTDTGCGIAPGELARVFDPYVQVGRRLAGREAGVGLGLAISREFARGMGGDLTVESTPGVGSTFTLTLPAA